VRGTQKLTLKIKQVVVVGLGIFIPSLRK